MTEAKMIPSLPTSPAAGYQLGDVIGGKYEVRGELGKGGFGVVYLTFDRETKRLCALKTFKDEFLADAATRALFKKEVLLWVNLGQHPNIVSARWVSEVSGRLFVEMDYIAPDANGCVTLHDHLKKARGPLPIEQVIRWAAQFCAGMAYAYDHGITSHRDIKPGNILIASDGTLKVSDFGLAVAAEAALWTGDGEKHSKSPSGIGGFSIWQSGGNGRCGTPGYMAPEVYRGESACIASDIYSFGLVLWQMAAGSVQPPFVGTYRGDIDVFLREIYDQQMKGCPPSIASPLMSVIVCCVNPVSSKRYLDFVDVHKALEEIHEKLTGDRLAAVVRDEQTAELWNVKGASLARLGRLEEALSCLDQALTCEPEYLAAWNNKGLTLTRMRRRDEALACYDKALTIAPEDVRILGNKANVLVELGRYEEAISCFEKLLTEDPRNAETLFNKGNLLVRQGKYDEALSCYSDALASDPKLAPAWNGKGVILAATGRWEESLDCYTRALTFDPLCERTWNNKGNTLFEHARYKEAVGCYDRVLALNPKHATAWYNKAVCEDALKKVAVTIRSYGKFLEVATGEHSKLIAYARQRIRELKGI